MAKQSSGKQRSNVQKSTSSQITLLDAKEFLFQLDGEIFNVEDATDEQFDRFIRQHIQMGWTLEDRVDAINLALSKGKTLGVMPDKNQTENQIAI